jgi:hypothetical protein
VISNVSCKSELTENDPEKVGQLLELHLAQKRAEWKRANARYRTIRSASFFCLFLLIIGTVAALFLVFSRLNEERGNPPGKRETVTSGR